MPRASGRFALSLEITSMPLPSPSRMSMMAKAGGGGFDARRALRRRDSHRGDHEAARLHGARQPVEEGLVVLDDQQRAVLRQRARLPKLRPRILLLNSSVIHCAVQSPG